MTFLKKYYLLFLILIFSSILISTNLNKPFFGHHDWNSAWYSHIARNFLKYGFLQTKFGSVMNLEYTTPENFQFSTHYPPVLPIALALSFKFFGIHEWTARIIPLLFSLGTITAIYFLGVKFFNKKTAVLASIFSTLMPLVVYFGKMPVQEVLTLAPVLLSVIFYFEFFQKPRRKNLLKVIASLVFSHLINWPGYYVTPLFFLHFLLFSKTKNKLLFASIFPMVSLSMFVLHALHLLILTKDPLGGGMIKILLFRLNLSEKSLGYSNLGYLNNQFHLILTYFTKPIVFLAAVTVVWMLKNYSKWKTSSQIQLLIILGIFGIVHNLVFRNMGFIHDYMIIYMWPFFALSAAWGFFLLLDKLNLKSKSKAIILATIVCILIIFPSRKFVAALQNSQNFKVGYDLGILIKERTNQKDNVLVLSPDFGTYYNVYANFYSDRNIIFNIPTENILQIAKSGDYKLIIAIPNRDTPKSQLEALQKNYKETKIGEFNIFNIK